MSCLRLQKKEAKTNINKAHGFGSLEYKEKKFLRWTSLYYLFPGCLLLALTAMRPSSRMKFLVERTKSLTQPYFLKFFEPFICQP